MHFSKNISVLRPLVFVYKFTMRLYKWQLKKIHGIKGFSVRSYAVTFKPYTYVAKYKDICQILPILQVSTA